MTTDTIARKPSNRVVRFRKMAGSSTQRTMIDTQRDKSPIDSNWLARQAEEIGKQMLRN